MRVRSAQSGGVASPASRTNIYRGDFTHLHKMAVEVSGRSEYVHTSDFSPEEKEKIRQVRKPDSHIIYWDRKLFF